jgi:hypothetical protein
MRVTKQNLDARVAWINDALSYVFHIPGAVSGRMKQKGKKDVRL